jgi:hypothetical protein
MVRVQRLRCRLAAQDASSTGRGAVRADVPDPPPIEEGAFHADSPFAGRAVARGDGRITVPSIQQEGTPMDFAAILAELIGGAVGGGAGGKIIKDSDLGNIGNIITGAIGGGIGGQLLNALVTGTAGGAAGGMDIGLLAGQLVGGGVAGAIVQIVVGLIKNKFLAHP